MVVDVRAEYDSRIVQSIRVVLSTRIFESEGGSLKLGVGSLKLGAGRCGVRSAECGVIARRLWGDS